MDKAEERYLALTKPPGPAVDPGLGDVQTTSRLQGVGRPVLARTWPCPELAASILRVSSSRLPGGAPVPRGSTKRPCLPHHRDSGIAAGCEIERISSTGIRRPALVGGSGGRASSFRAGGGMRTAGLNAAGAPRSRKGPGDQSSDRLGTRSAAIAPCQPHHCRPRGCRQAKIWKIRSARVRARLLAAASDAGACSPKEAGPLCRVPLGRRWLGKGVPRLGRLRQVPLPPPAGGRPGSGRIARASPRVSLGLFRARRMLRLLRRLPEP
jgi:hypothetical protein